MLAKKWLFAGIITLLSLSVAIAQDPPANHPTTGEPLVIDVFRGSPDIDGDLSDWNLGAMIPAVLDAQEQLSDDSPDKANWDSPEDNSAEFYLLWDDENIYIAAVVKDDRLSMNKTGNLIWNADAVEVFFSTLNAVSGHDEHYQYGFNANEQTWNWDDMEGAGGAVDYLTVASTETPEGYICEVSIPHAEITPFDWSAGSTIGFHPVIDDTDNGDRELQMTWTGLIAHDQSQGYGHMILSDIVVSGGGNPLARRPDPKEGTLLEATWAQLGWKPGKWAVSHDLYIGDNFDDVNNGTAETFAGNLDTDTVIVGFPTFPVPGGLTPGTTYYWRVDEVNDANAASPWKGDIWSFSILPYTASAPDPADGAEFVDLDATLSWKAGYGVKLHTVFIGDNYDDVLNATAGGTPSGTPTLNPGTLEAEKVMYWRVDQFDGLETYKGDVWAFTTPGAVGNPQPANGAADVQKIATLSWTPADNATSHELYFGTDAEAVKNATTASPEYIGPRALGAESYDPGGLAWDSSYAWRVDEVYPTGTVKGLVWTLTSADFLSVDDFEAYNDIDPPDANSFRIFDMWADGFLNPTTNGALVGNDLPPYAEQGIVHGGIQSMIYAYDNAGKTSEATLTLVWPKDWTEEGVT
ncbi:MAG: sugar-binding protein, partial [Planctomycetota bacterium]